MGVTTGTALRARDEKVGMRVGSKDRAQVKACHSAEGPC